MCRWFTYLGLEDQLLEDILLRPSHSIVKQIDLHFLPAEHASFDPSKHQPSAISPPPVILSSKTKARLHHPASANDTGSPNALTNMDGFGLGWWTGAYEEFDSGAQGKQASRPGVYKSTRPPLNDLVLKSLARGVKTRSVVAHVRAGTGLTPVVETNCHPFTYGRHLFCHNGVLGAFHLFRPLLLSNLPLRYQMSLLGTTDSEHCAALYFYHLCGEDGDWEKLYPVAEMGAAMCKTVQVLEKMKSAAEAKAGRGSAKEKEADHSSLNFLVSSGASLVAIRFSSPKEHKPPSLYYSTTTGATLNRKFRGHPDEGKPGVLWDEGEIEKGEHRKHVIVGSEPNTFNVKEWKLIAPGEMILVDEEMEITAEALDI